MCGSNSSNFNLGLRIILAYVFANTLGVNFINLSMPISTFVSIFFNIILWKYSKSYKIASESIKQINLGEIEIQ